MFAFAPPGKHWSHNTCPAVCTEPFIISSITFSNCFKMQLCGLCLNNTVATASSITFELNCFHNLVTICRISYKYIGFGASVISCTLSASLCSRPDHIRTSASYFALKRWMKDSMQQASMQHLFAHNDSWYCTSVVRERHNPIVGKAPCVATT